jgi:hypothetical protein
LSPALYKLRFFIPALLLLIRSKKSASFRARAFSKGVIWCLRL